MPFTKTEIIGTILPRNPAAVNVPWESHKSTTNAPQCLLQTYLQ